MTPLGTIAAILLGSVAIAWWRDSSRPREGKDAAPGESVRRSALHDGARQMRLFLDRPSRGGFLAAAAVLSVMGLGNGYALSMKAASVWDQLPRVVGGRNSSHALEGVVVLAVLIFGVFVPVSMVTAIVRRFVARTNSMTHAEAAVWLATMAASGCLACLSWFTLLKRLIGPGSSLLDDYASMSLALGSRDADLPWREAFVAAMTPTLIVLGMSALSRIEHGARDERGGAALSGFDGLHVSIALGNALGSTLVWMTSLAVGVFA